MPIANTPRPEITAKSQPELISVELSARRTGLSFQRTRMSADRTLMSVIRTSLSLIGFGFTIFHVHRRATQPSVLSIELSRPVTRSRKSARVRTVSGFPVHD